MTAACGRLNPASGSQLRRFKTMDRRKSRSSASRSSIQASADVSGKPSRLCDFQWILSGAGAFACQFLTSWLQGWQAKAPAPLRLLFDLRFRLERSPRRLSSQGRQIDSSPLSSPCAAACRRGRRWRARCRYLTTLESAEGALAKVPSTPSITGVQRDRAPQRMRH